MEACGSPFFCFLPDLWRLPGHFLSAETVCPGCEAFPGIFFFWGGGLSRFVAFFGIFSFCCDGLSRFWCRNEDVLLVQGMFVPKAVRFSG